MPKVDVPQLGGHMTQKVKLVFFYIQSVLNSSQGPRFYLSQFSFPPASPSAPEEVGSALPSGPHLSLPLSLSLSLSLPLSP